MPHILNPFTGHLDLQGVVLEELDRIPTSSDIRRPGTEILNTVTDKYYKLIDVTDGLASWQEVSSGSIDFEESCIAIVDASAPPPTEVLGDRYVLDNTGVVNAAWDGAAHYDVVEFGGVFWNAYTPTKGTMIYNEDTTTLYIFDGLWEPISAAINDATTTTKGIASFNDTYFDVTAGVVSIDAVATTTTSGLIELANDSETQLLADTSRALTPDGMAALFAVEKQSGFGAWTGSGSYYTVTGNDFTLDRPGYGWIKTKLVTWAGAQTVASLTNGTTSFIYVDDTGTIGSSTIRNTALYENNIVLFEVWFDNSGTPNYVVVKENHSLETHPHTMQSLHDVGLHGFDVHRTGGVIALHGTVALQIIGATDWHDHDLETTVPDSGAAAITINVVYTDGTGKWVIASSGTTLPTQYNNAGTPTALAGNERSIYEIRVSKDDLESAAPKYFAIMNAAKFANLALAEAAVANGNYSSVSNELAELETIRLGTVVINAATIDTVNSSKQTIGTGSLSSTASSANLVSVSTVAFNGILSAADTTVQTALNTLDDYVPSTLLTTAAPSTDLFSSGVKIVLTANENQAFGDICKINTDGEAAIAKADVIANAGAVVMCVSATVTANNPGNYLLMGVARQDTWNWTVGGLIYLTITGTTTNTLSQTAPVASGNVVQVVGVATHADRLIFNPNLAMVELV